MDTEENGTPAYDAGRFDAAAERLIYGGADASDREYVIYSFLPMVKNMATRYADRGVPSEELAQEGNLALVIAVDEIAGMGDVFLESGKGMRACCEKYFRDKVREYIIRLIDGESRYESEFSAAVAKAGLVYEAAKHLAEEYGRLASLAELSGYTRIPEEEIRDIIRFSGDSISFGDGKDNI